MGTLIKSGLLALLSVWLALPAAGQAITSTEEMYDNLRGHYGSILDNEDWNKPDTVDNFGTGITPYRQPYIGPFVPVRPLWESRVDPRVPGPELHFGE